MLECHERLEEFRENVSGRPKTYQRNKYLGQLVSTERRVTTRVITEKLIGNSKKILTEDLEMTNVSV